MNNNKFYLITCDDWQVLYGVDGKKISEGHEIRWNVWFEVGQKNPEAKLCDIYLEEENQEEYDLWDFPDNFYDLPLAIQNLFK